MAYDAAARRIRGDAAITNFRPGETLPVAAPHDRLHGATCLSSCYCLYRMRAVEDPWP